MANAPEFQSQFDEARAQRRRKLINVRVGNYVLCDYLGDGGVGTVYKSQQDNPRRFVAVKILSSGLLTESGPEDFLAEANRLGRLQHPNIAQIYEAGTHDEGPISLPFYAMELVRDGLPIATYVRKSNFNGDQIIQLFLGVCDAVMHAHEQGIFHCDLKPGNILVDSNGMVKVIDFGIARAAESDQPGKTLSSASSIIRGTPQYMSPEQFTAREGAVTERSDVYSMGVVLYEMLCEKLPYIVSKKDTLAAIRTVTEVQPMDPRDANPQLGRGAEALLLKCLKKDPAERYQSVALLREDLVRLRNDDSSVHALAKRRIANPFSTATRWIGRHRLVTALIALPLVWLVCAIALPMWDENQLVFIFQSYAVTHFKHFPDIPLSNVRIVALASEDLKALARTLGLGDIDFTSPRAPRVLHGAFMQRLAKAHCSAKALVWDIQFLGNTQFDEAFANGVRAMRQARVPVVVAGPWSTTSDEPATSAKIAASGAQFGGMTGNLGDIAAWSVDVARQHRNDAAQPSIALLGAMNFWYGPAATLELYQEGLVARLGSAAKPIRVSGMSTMTAYDESRDFGFRDGDVIAGYNLEVPSDQSLARSTIDYAAVASASDEQLRAWFNQKVIVIGDARAGKDGPIAYPDGRQLHGFAAQAVAIQRLLDEQPILCVEMVSIFNARITIAAVIAIVAAMVGMLLGFILAGRSLARFGIELVIVVATLYGALALYSYAAKLHSPATGILVFVITCESLAFIKRTGQKQRDQLASA